MKQEKKETDMNMKKLDLGVSNYRKFLYYFKNKIKVHFKDLDEIWYNGFILDLNEEKLTLVLAEDMRGTLPILLECVKPSSISEYRERAG